VAVEAFAGIDPAEATLDLWGADSAAPDYARHVRAAAGPSVRLHAPFEEADKARLLGGLHALIVPSVGLESFGLVAREALWLGVPVIASRLGALTELMDEGHAIGFEAGDVASLRATIDNLLADPRQLLACVPAARPKTMEAHAAEIESLYASVLGRLSATRRA
jgi:glycosyltransferase involved in cell wall biosynthesis